MVPCMSAIVAITVWILSHWKLKNSVWMLKKFCQFRCGINAIALFYVLTNVLLKDGYEEKTNSAEVCLQPPYHLKMHKTEAHKNIGV